MPASERRGQDPQTRRKSRGQSLVEFALVLPVFVFLLFGLIDVGRFVYMNSVLSQGAREGARTAAVEASWLGSSDASCGTAGGPTCPATTAALKADVTDAANRMVSPFGAVSSVNIRCDDAGGAPTGNWTVGGGVSCPAIKSQTGKIVSVRVTLTFNALTPVISGILGTINSSGSATMVIN